MVTLQPNHGPTTSSAIPYSCGNRRPQSFNNLVVATPLAQCAANVPGCENDDAGHSPELPLHFDFGFSYFFLNRCSVTLRVAARFTPRSTSGRTQASMTIQRKLKA